MNEADNILAGERSRNRPDRIVNAFAPGYVIAESDETNNTMCIMTFTNAPGEGPPPHTHTVEDETFIVHEGVLEFYQDDRTFTGHPGDVVYLVRGKRHYFKVISGNPAKYTVIFPFLQDPLAQKEHNKLISKTPKTKIMSKSQIEDS